MAKYAFMLPFDCYCVECNTKFYEYEVEHPWWAIFFMDIRDIFSKRNPWDGRCPKCKKFNVSRSLMKEFHRTKSIDDYR